MFCFHKWGPPNEKRIQACTKCNKICIVECAHKFKIIDKTYIENLQNSRIVGVVYTVQCEICGVIDREAINYSTL